MTRILGIDPGSRKAGIAIIDLQGSEINYIHCQTLYFCKNDDVFLNRITLINDLIEQVMKVYQPTHVAMESLIYVKSPTALIKLAQARGVMLAVIAKYNPSSIFEYSPNLVKSSTTGDGHASKESVQKFLKSIFPKAEFSTDDASDALLVAFCHALQSRNVLPISSATKRSKKMSSLSASLAHAIKEQ